jgi:hypothetical protein
LPVATDIEMHCIGQASPHIVAADSITGLVRAAADAETPTAVFKHLRHEGESVEAPIVVERPEDFLLAPDLHPVASTCIHINILSSPVRATFELLAANADELVMVKTVPLPVRKRARPTTSLHTKPMSLVSLLSKKAMRLLLRSNP